MNAASGITAISTACEQGLTWPSAVAFVAGAFAVAYIFGTLIRNS